MLGNDCRGCQEYKENNDQCMAPGIGSRYKMFKNICPCAICIVKMICDNSIRCYPFSCANFRASRAELFRLEMRYNHEQDDKDEYSL